MWVKNPYFIHLTIYGLWVTTITLYIVVYCICSHTWKIQDMKDSMGYQKFQIPAVINYLADFQETEHNTMAK